jgi:phage terminase Nu1 subunit (DNA packaging protein)
MSGKKQGPAKPARKAKGKRASKAARRPEPHWLNHNQMAQSCGISVTALRTWGVRPVAKIGRSVYYTVEGVLHNRLALQAEKYRNQMEDMTDQQLARTERESRLRLTAAQAEGQEIKNAQLRKELAPVDLIEWVLGKAGGEISAILDALPTVLKKRNPKLTASNIETIRREIAKAQNVAARLTVDIDEYYEPTGADRERK